jgi:hypothetical protein
MHMQVKAYKYWYRSSLNRVICMYTGILYRVMRKFSASHLTTSTGHGVSRRSRRLASSRPTYRARRVGACRYRVDESSPGRPQRPASGPRCPVVAAARRRRFPQSSRQGKERFLQERRHRRWFCLGEVSTEPKLREGDRGRLKSADPHSRKVVRGECRRRRTCFAERAGPDEQSPALRERPRDRMVCGVPREVCEDEKAIPMEMVRSSQTSKASPG